MMNNSALSVPQLALVDGRPVTSSVNVADFFGKRHTHVLRAIESLDVPDDFRRPNFGPSSYLNAQGKPQPMVNLTRKGFTILAMGFTGKEAMRFKIAYIEAFDRMESELLELASGGSRKTVDLNHYRRTLSPSGLDIRYTLDLTKIIVKPSRMTLTLLERITGIDLSDIRVQESFSLSRAEESVQRFLVECCREAEGARTQSSILYGTFVQWHEANVEGYTPGIVTFSRIVATCYQRKKSNGIWFVGVELRGEEVTA